MSEQSKENIATKIQGVDETRMKREFLDEAFEQKLPSEKDFDWSNPNDKANSSCRLKEDARVKAYDKAQGEWREYSGKEFNAHMRESYGTDVVQYNAKEPDFSPFEQSFSKEKVDKYLIEKYGEKSGREAKGNALGHVEVSKIDSERRITQGEATERVADQLGISKDDVLGYMKSNNVTWHECGDGKTVRAVPTEVNGVYKHTGGIALETDMQAVADVSMLNKNNPKPGEEISGREFVRRNKAELSERKKEIKEGLKSKETERVPNEQKSLKIKNEKENLRVNRRAIKTQRIKHRGEVKSLKENKQQPHQTQRYNQSKDNAFSRARRHGGKAENRQSKNNAFTRAKSNRADKARGKAPDRNQSRGSGKATPSKSKD